MTVKSPIFLPSFSPLRINELGCLLMNEPGCFCSHDVSFIYHYITKLPLNVVAWNNSHLICSPLCIRNSDRLICAPWRWGLQLVWLNVLGLPGKTGSLSFQGVTLSNQPGAGRSKTDALASVVLVLVLDVSRTALVPRLLVCLSPQQYSRTALYSFTWVSL